MTDNVENVQAETPQTEVAADATKNEAVQDSQQVEESQPKQEPNGYEKRIARLTAARHAEARKVQELQAELAKYTATKEEADPAPKEADFDSVEEYNKAVGKWEARQEFAKQTKAEREKAEVEKRAEIARAKEAAHKKLEAEFVKQYADYNERAAIFNESLGYVDTKSTQFKALADAVFSSENTPAIVYELGKDPDAIEQLLQKTPAQIYREVTRIELRYEAKQPESEEVKETKTISAPPTPIKGTGKVQKKLEDMSYNELKKRMGL